ncbi:MAG: caspase family protein [Desulfamplus sp.]|nr:caspase family protein [Desulfamplus sp.]
MKKNYKLYCFFVTITLLLFSMNSSNAVENIFYVNPSLYQFSGPSNIANLDDGLSIAVINRISKKLSKIKHNQVVLERAIENFEPFDLLAINNHLFVSSKKSGEIKVLSQIDFSLIKTIQVSKSVSYMALSSDKLKIFAASPLRSADTINIIDVASKNVISPPIYTPDLNQVDKLITRDGKLFASSQISSSIGVFDEKYFLKEGIHNFGLTPDDMVIAGRYLYLSSIEEQLIRVINLESFEKVKDIQFNGSPGRMIFDEKQYIYVLNNDRTGKVFRIDINTNEFDDKSCFQSGHCFYTGSNPEDALISKDGKVLYVSNYSDNSITWHSIAGKVFIEPRTITVKPVDDSGVENTITLKAGGGSGNYTWSAAYGNFSALSGEEVIFTPPSGEDIYEVTVTDNSEPSPLTATAKIIVVDIRVTPERLTVSDQTPKIFNITGGTPPYEVFALQGGSVEHSSGESYFTFFPPSKDGIYTIEVKDKNSGKAYPTVELEGVPPLPVNASRAAIIVAGGPPDVGKNAIWREVKFATEKIYKILTTQKGFTKEQIYLLSPVDLDGDGDGFPDSIIRNTQGHLQESHIESAFQWATKLNKLDQPLLVFLLGHGVKDRFMLNLSDSSLEASKLNNYLKEYQSSSGKDVVIIIDACHSGSFIDDISGNGRAVITSTGENNSAFYTMQSTNSLSSFISYFSDGISRGCNLLESYSYACDNLKKFYSNAICSKQHSAQQYFFQNPQYDDNGDGKYYDIFLNLKTEDGSMLKDIYIHKPTISNYFAGELDDFESQFDIASNTDMTLSIVSMNSKTVETISKNNAVTLKAKIGIAQGDVKSVYGILKPPGMKIPLDNNGIAHISYPKIRLEKTEEYLNLESYNSQIWSTQWQGAVYQGCYEISFYAQSINGGITFSDAVSFSVYDAPKPPDKPSIEIIFNEKKSSEKDAYYKYFKGGNISISLIEHLNWGYDLYIAVILPDDKLLSFSGLNQITVFTGNIDSIVKWQDERYQSNKVTILDMEVLDSMPKGKYQIYALMSPEGKSIFSNSEYWILSSNSFEIF